MILNPEVGPNRTGFDVPATFKKSELSDIVETYRAGKRITPDTAARFIGTNLPDREPLIRKIDAGVVGVLGGVNVASETAVERAGGDLPAVWNMPGWLSNTLGNVYENYPLGAEHVESAALRDHVPQLALGAALGYTTFQVGRKLFSARRGYKFDERARDAQAGMREAYENGTMRWAIEPGSSVAFVGSGDPLAAELARRRVLMPIAHAPVEGPWTYLAADADHSQTMEALDRADLGNAGELLLFPIKPTQEFLPGNNDHDIDLDRIVYYINAADEYCGDSKLPVLVVGSKSQSETYANSEDIHHNTKGWTVTLEKRLETLASDRGQAIEIKDPSEIIAGKIIGLASGRPVMLEGTKGSIDMYGERFASMFGLSPEDPAENAVRVRYNQNDLPTVNGAQPDDIVVVLDPAQKASLEARGIPKERVLVVSEEVLKVLPPIFE